MATARRTDQKILEHVAGSLKEESSYGLLVHFMANDEFAPEGCPEGLELIDSTFKRLKFCRCYIDEAREAESYFRVIANMKPLTKIHHYFICYITGYGGYDQMGGLYLLLTSDTSEKLYIKSLVDILKERYIKGHKGHVCILLLDFCLRDTDHEISIEDLLPRCYGNMVIAMSGLRKEKDSFNENGGIWTQELCNSLKKAGNVPLQCILDEIKETNPYSNYVSFTSVDFLNGKYVKTYVDHLDQLICGKESGVIVVATSSDNSSDKNAVLATFKKLGFVLIVVNSYDEILASIQAVSYYQNYTASNKFFAFYYSGYGGSDSDGRLYIHHGDTDSPDNTRIYIDWIVSLYNQRFSSHLPCLMLFEMTSKSAPNDDPLLLPICNNSLLAISGLNTANGGRTKDGGRWTQLLCQYINQCDEPISSILDKLPPQLPDLAPQYVNSMGFAYLQKLHEVLIRVEGEGYKYFMNHLR